MPPGWLVKATAIYDEPFWRADGLSGEALNEQGPVTMTFDNTPPDGSPGALVGFVGGRDARAFARLGKSERRARRARLLRVAVRAAGAAGRALHRARLGRRAAGPAAARSANFATGGWTASGPALREPVGPIHWAGTETATRWAGYIDGAVSSGERAAAEVLAARCTPGPGANRRGRGEGSPAWQVRSRPARLAR